MQMELRDGEITVHLASYCGSDFYEFSIFNKLREEYNLTISTEDLFKLNTLFSMAVALETGDFDKMNTKKNMPFRQAWFELLNGKKVRLSSWKGYWAWENNTIMMHCADGTVLDIRKTDNPAFTFSNIATDDWEVVEE